LEISIPSASAMEPRWAATSLAAGRDLAGCDASQVVALAARQHREGDLLGIGRCEDEEAAGRRLFEGLEQGVEGGLRQHVDLVDDEDPVLAGGGRVADRLDQLANVVNARAARCVDLLYVRRVAGNDLLTGMAGATGRVRRPLLAVEAAGQDPCEGGLADAARARQQQGVGHPIASNGVTQRRGDVALAHHLIEGLRPPLARCDLIAHGGRPQSGGISRGHSRGLSCGPVVTLL